MEYKKLVRDRIPQIIAEQGGVCQTRILSEEEYRVSLEAKLDEEVAEYHRDQNLQELADILEVLFALAAANGYNREDLMSAYEDKHMERGGFEKRIFLISSHHAEEK